MLETFKTFIMEWLEEILSRLIKIIIVLSYSWHAETAYLLYQLLMPGVSRESEDQ